MLMQISWRADGTNFLAEQGLEDDILWRLNAVHADRDANLILDEIHHAEIHVQPDLRLWIGLLERGDMLTRGVDVLILTPVNGDSAGALVRKANRAKVPVVDYNFLALKADVACFIGRDAVQMAKSIAQAAVKQAPTGNYILALGEESTSVAQEERKGYLNVLKPYVELGEIQIVSEQFNKGWSTESARAQVENALTRSRTTWLLWSAPTMAPPTAPSRPCRRRDLPERCSSMAWTPSRAPRN